MINKNDKFTFIHIGKCGGSTVATTLKNNQIDFDEVHVGKAKKDYLVIEKLNNLKVLTTEQYKILSR